jgi:peptide deformylase
MRIVGDPCLRERAQEVKQITQEEKKLFSRMAQMMYDAEGVGLAAPQIGISRRMVVIDAGSGLYKLANPRILRGGGSVTQEEGCLSVPGVGIKVRRQARVVVEALDEDNKTVVIEAEGLLARVFQHEIDHLNGTLIIDHASLIEKLKYKKAIEGLKRNGKTV